MKKLFLIFLIFGITQTVWAQNLNIFSLGGGAFFGNDSGGGIEGRISIPGQSVIFSVPLKYNGGGAFVFFDVKYLKADIGLYFGGGACELITGMPYNQSQEIGDFSFTSLNLGLSGKYPFTVSPKIIIFPLLGFDYKSILNAVIDDEKVVKPEDWSQFWFKFGGGLDYQFNKKWFLRFDILYGFRLASRAEKDLIETINEYFDFFASQIDDISPKLSIDTIPGKGLTAKISVGYRF